MLTTSDDATFTAPVDRSRVRIMSESSPLLERRADRRLAGIGSGREGLDKTGRRPRGPIGGLMSETPDQFDSRPLLDEGFPYESSRSYRTHLVLAGPGDVGGNEEWGPPLEAMEQAGGSEDVIGPAPVDAGISVPDGVDSLSDICEKARGVKLEARVGPSTSVRPSPRRHTDKHRSERTIFSQSIRSSAKARLSG
jgi:hypothetical protein